MATNNNSNIITSRVLSFITLEDGSLHTYEARPRTMVPEGYIAAGTEVNYLRHESIRGLPNKWVGQVVGGELAGSIVRLHDPSHVTMRAPKAAPTRTVSTTGAAASAATVNIATLSVEQLEQMIAAKKIAAAQKLLEAKALLEAAGALVEMPDEAPANGADEAHEETSEQLS